MQRTLIIAEAGVNHNGDLNIAKELIVKAHEVGADIVKFQTGLPQNVMSVHAPKAEYQIENTKNDTESQLEMANKFALQYEEFKELKIFAEKIGISFLSTPFDIESVDYLDSIGMKLWKIPSGEITNYPYLVHIANTKKPVILSTGMSTMEEVRKAFQILQENGTTEIKLLHCTTEYPAPYSSVNLRAMLTLKEEFNVDVGYSDHTMGIEVPIAAVAMGAKIIEKHFTLDRNMIGPDHKASLEPEELKQMVTAIRNIENALGDGEKIPSSTECKNIPIARKSIVAKRAIKKGEIIREDMITTKRPGNGISPMKWQEIIGMKAIRNFEEDELIEI